MVLQRPVELAPFIGRWVRLPLISWANSLARRSILGGFTRRMIINNQYRFHSQQADRSGRSNKRARPGRKYRLKTIPPNERRCSLQKRDRTAGESHAEPAR